jgi:hypothetical protein
LYEGRFLGTTTLYRLGWLKTEVYDRWKIGDPTYEIIQFDSTENPRFPQKEFDRMRDSMPLWKFRMFYQGQYDKPAGLVYDSFDDTLCVHSQRFEIPSSWMWYVGHDFGGSNPAALFYAQNPMGGDFWMVYEFKPFGAVTTSEQVKQFGELMKGRIVLQRRGGAHNEDGWRNDYTAQGWPIIPPMVPEVDVGIARVYGLHRRNAIHTFRDNKAYLDEKTSYSYKMAENYLVMDEIENPKRYHLMDAERYILSGFNTEGVGGRKPKTVRRAVY